MATKVKAEQAAVKYPLESLRNNCRAVFGVSLVTFLARPLISRTVSTPRKKFSPALMRGV